MKAQKLGFAKALNPLTVTPRQTASAVHDILADGSYGSRAAQVQKVALQADGVANTVAVIRDFL